MREAMNAVTNQGMSISKTSLMYGIPRTTLNDHILGKVHPGAKAGAPTLLSSREEQELVDFLCKSADIGYAKTRQEVLEIVSQMVDSERTVSNGWWSKFIMRNHDLLSLRAPSILSISRKCASSEVSLNNYFDILEQTLDESGLIEYPSLIFNMDESGFPLDPKPLKTVHPYGTRNPYCVSSGSKAQISIAACVSATGQALPPFIIFKRKSLPPEMSIGEIPGTVYALSEKGWMNSFLFHSWFKKVFLHYAPASRPLLLLLDGHSSHYCPETIKLATENNIIIFTLPPNTTHLTQPLDKGVFGPFKMHWKRVCHDYMATHLGQVINHYNFVRLFAKAWVESMTTTNIVAGFETTGIYPINRYAVRIPREPNVQKEKILPNVTFTPVKRYTEVGVFSSSEIPASPTFENPRPPRSLPNILTMPSPQLKPVKSLSPSDRVISGPGVDSNNARRKKPAKSDAPNKSKKCK